MSVIRNTYACSKQWEDLQGGDGKRNCSQCNHAVHDLRGKSDNEIARLGANGSFCGIIETKRLFDPLRSWKAGLALASLSLGTVIPVFGQQVPTEIKQDTSSVLHTIKGTLLDKDTKEPLIGGTVVLKRNGVLLTGAVTDIDGKFKLEFRNGSIEPNEILELESNSIGYSKFTRKAKLRDLLKSDNIVMSASGHMTMGIMVIERPSVINREGSNEQTINRTDIQRMPR